MKGFTLVELLVSIAIFTVITTAAIFSHAQFNSSILLTDLTYEIALSIRQAQFYGISVKQNSSSTFNSGYGVHFDKTSPATYVLFEDKQTQNHICDSNECGNNALQTFNIQKGNKISKLCVAGDCTKDIVDISFLRPNPDAYITINGAGSSVSGPAEICVTSADGSVNREITVESTGQISVGADPTTCN